MRRISALRCAFLARVQAYASRRKYSRALNCSYLRFLTSLVSRFVDNVDDNVTPKRYRKIEKLARGGSPLERFGGGGSPLYRFFIKKS